MLIRVFLARPHATCCRHFLSLTSIIKCRAASCGSLHDSSNWCSRHVYATFHGHGIHTQVWRSPTHSTKNSVNGVPPRGERGTYANRRGQDRRIGLEVAVIEAVNGLGGRRMVSRYVDQNDRGTEDV